MPKDLTPKQTYFPVNKHLAPYYATKYNELWQEFLDREHRDDKIALLRWYFRNDLFFLLYYGLNRTDINQYNKSFIVEACQEVQDGPQTDTVDLWFRGGYKSTIITQGRTLQELIGEEPISVGIFSHTRPIAKDFMLPLKAAFESNEYLRYAFPDIIWSYPRKEAPVWSMDAGLELKRDSVSNTHSLEAWGLVDGMPTSKHYHLRVYDDVITDKVVTTPDMMHKAESQFRLSDNLATDGGRQRIVGTNYSYGDFYQTLTDEEEKGIYPWIIRCQPWYDSKNVMDDEEKVDTPLGFITLFGYQRPILFTPQQIYEKRVKQGAYIFNCQMALNPTQDDSAEFKFEWLKYYQELPTARNKYILVDPANEKDKTSDYTVIVLISIDASGNKYLEDMVRDKLNLGERWDAIKLMVHDHPDILCCWYEKYGKDSDIWYFEQKQKEEGVYFTIEAMGGSVAKRDRVRRFVPICEQGKFYLPEGGIVYRGRDVVKEFINEEYSVFPFCKTFDMIDIISRIEDPGIKAIGPISNKENIDHAIEDYYEAVSCEANI